MEEAKLHEFIREIKEYIFDNFNLNQLSDEELEEQIEELIRKPAPGRISDHRGTGGYRAPGVQLHPRLRPAGHDHE